MCYDKILVNMAAYVLPGLGVCACMRLLFTARARAHTHTHKHT
jgi:hypothetical protein